jgi:hypothetical protein
MKKVKKITSNHQYKPFKKINGEFIVECYGIKAHVDDFHKITDKQKEENPLLEKWDFIIIQPGASYHENIVLSADFTAMMYKYGNVSYYE